MSSAYFAAGPARQSSTEEKRKASPAGFPEAGEEMMLGGLDLNEELIRNKANTYILRVSGDAMTGAGIHDSDLVIVDRSARAASGKVVIASLNGDLLIRRLEKTMNRIRLVPESPRLAPIEVDPSGAEFSVWGVVTYVIHAP